MKVLITIILTWILAGSAELFQPTAALARWEADGNLVRPEADGVRFRNHVLSDDAGGALVVWEESPGDSRPNNIFCSRLTGLGDRYPGWPADGVPLGSTPSFNSGPDAVPDGQGGTFVSWIGAILVNPFQGYNGFVQHIEASGVLASHWPAAGVQVCTGTSGFPRVAQDGAGGVLVTWDDNRNGDGNHDIYAQHLTADGGLWPSWPTNGLGVNTSLRDDVWPRILSDGSGGAFICWSSFVSADVYLQRITATGDISPGWPADGVLVCGAAGDQFEVVMTPDGAGGVILAWYDSRNDDGDIYAQRITAQGTVSPGWSDGGMPVCMAPLDQGVPQIAAVDGGRVVIIWDDRRNDTSFQVYAQCLTPDGKVADGWPMNGLPLGQSAGSHSYGAIVADQTGGAIVVWSDRRSGEGDIYAEHLLPNGQLFPGWPADGVPLCRAPGNQDEPSITSDGEGGAIVSWTDSRRAPWGDIYAARVTAAGVTGPAIVAEPPRLQAVGVRPNPLRDHADIWFQLPSPAPIEARIFDLRGRAVVTLAANCLFQAGPGSLTWSGQDNEGRVVRPGVYFVQVKSPINIMTARMVKLQ